MSDQTYHMLERRTREEVGADLHRLDESVRTRIIGALCRHDEAERGIQANPGWDSPPPDPVHPLAIQAPYRRVIKVHRNLIKVLLSDNNLGAFEALAHAMKRAGLLPRSLMERVAQLIELVANPATAQEPSPGSLQYNSATHVLERVVRAEPVSEDCALHLVKSGESVRVRVVHADGTMVDDLAVNPRDAASMEAVTEKLGELGPKSAIYWLADPENVLTFFKLAFIMLFVIDGLETIRDIAGPQLTVEMMSQYARVIKDGRGVEILGFTQKWRERLQGPFASFLGYTTRFASPTAALYFGVVQQLPAVIRGRLYYQIIDEVERAQEALRTGSLVTAVR